MVFQDALLEKPKGKKNLKHFEVSIFRIWIIIPITPDP